MHDHWLEICLIVITNYPTHRRLGGFIDLISCQTRKGHFNNRDGRFQLRWKMEQNLKTSKNIHFFLDKTSHIC